MYNVNTSLAANSSKCQTAFGSTGDDDDEFHKKNK
jgi:hypothetical protein